MADLNGFNANDHEDMADFSALPEGWYLVNITKDEVKTSQANQASKYLKIEMTVLDGPFKGRKVWNNLNLWYDNVDASKKQNVIGMAQREMATLCRTVNVLNPASSEQLYNIPFGIKIKHKKNDLTGEMDDTIGKYCSEREFASKSSSNPAPTAANNNAASNTPAWGRA